MPTLRRSTSLAAAMAMLALGCRSDGATGGANAPAQFGFRADVSAPVGATLLIRALYLRRSGDGASPRDTVEINRTTIVVQPGTTRLALDLDLAACLADANRVVPGPTCAVVGEVTLFAGTTVIDRALLAPTAVGPGAVVIAAGTVVLGNVRTVAVTPPTAVLRVGGTTTLVATARDASGNPITDRAVIWTSDNPAVAAVNGSGVVTGVSAGTARITATVGGQSGQSTLTVVPAVASVAITPNPASVSYGAAITLTVTAKDAAGNVLSLAGRTVSWSSSNTQVATITQAGVATGVSPGTSTITASVDGVSNTDTLTVLGATIVANPTSLDFIGEAGGDPPSGQRINITNGALNPLDGLALTVTYGAGQPTGWLTATLNGTTAPTTIDAGVSLTGLPLGDFTATIRVTSPRAGNSPLDIPVQFHVRVVFADIQAGGDHTCGLSEFGEIYCWGLNDRGQLGTGTNTPSSVPVRVNDGSLFLYLAVGASHTCGFAATGSPVGALRCWGANGSGQLGDGTLVDRNTPVVVTGGIGFNPAFRDNLAAGGLHTCAADAAARLWCWGDNSRNQLGIGPFSTTGTKITVPTATDLMGGSSLALGSMHSCARDANIRAICWGDNSQGQVGSNVGTMSSGTTFNLVIVGALVRDVGTGPSANHSCFVRSTDLISCWGANAGGQLGDGTRISRFTAAVVGTRLYVGRYDAFGASHTCAILRIASGPSIDCWGSNSNGQLGVAGGDQLTPSTIPAFRAFLLTAGDNHSCGYMEDNNVYCWGKNSVGQLGDGTTTDRFTPTLVKFTLPGSLFYRGTRLAPVSTRHQMVPLPRRP
ncbi:MAG: Ig-like domain-containing protein [Gemmatimonadaceae bacterium]